MPRLARGRGIKTPWSYTVAEAARALSVTRNTVRNWIKDGLPIVSDRKPYLILGRDLKAHLDTRSAKRINNVTNPRSNHDLKGSNEPW